MLMLKSPSLVINSCDIPWPKYRMWESVNAPPGLDAAGTVSHIVRVNRLALEHERTQLLNIVINCHGAEGGGALYIGGLDYPAARINSDSVGAFSVLRGRNLGTIWLVACQAAEGYLGKDLCRKLAMTTGSQVVAADEDQDTGIWGGFRVIQGGGRGQIDEFEGDVYRFTPDGGMGITDPHESIFTILE
jgi:hypothetical protein